MRVAIGDTAMRRKIGGLRRRNCGTRSLTPSIAADTTDQGAGNAKERRFSGDRKTTLLREVTRRYRPKRCGVAQRLKPASAMALSCSVAVRTSSGSTTPSVASGILPPPPIT